MRANRSARQARAKESRKRAAAARRVLRARLVAGVLVGDELPALRLDRAQPRVEHRRVDEVDRSAAARELLTGAQPVDGALQIAERVACFGFSADRAQRL